MLRASHSAETLSVPLIYLGAWVSEVVLVGLPGTHWTPDTVNVEPSDQCETLKRKLRKRVGDGLCVHCTFLD
jgi:hypothetical protein